MKLSVFIALQLCWVTHLSAASRVVLPLEDFYEVIKTGKGKCSIENVERLNTMFKDMQRVAEYFKQQSVTSSANTNYWTHPQPWFNELLSTFFGVTRASSGPDGVRAREALKRTADKVAESLTIPPSPGARKDQLYCDSTMLQLKLQTSRVPFRLAKIGDPFQSMLSYLGDRVNFFSDYWWLYLPSQGKKGSWAVLSRLEWPGIYGKPNNKLFRNRAIQLPFQTNPKGGSPNYCSGVPKGRSSFSFAIRPQQVDFFPPYRRPEHDRYWLMKRPILILCPIFFDSPTTRDTLDLQPQPEGTHLQAMAPTWMPWYKAILEMRRTMKDHELVRYVGEYPMPSPLDLTKKGDFHTDKNWIVASPEECQTLALWQDARPVSRDPVTHNNSESWVWFFIAVGLSALSGLDQNWASLSCSDPRGEIPRYEEYPPENELPPYEELPPYRPADDYLADFKGPSHPDPYFPSALNVTSRDSGNVTTRHLAYKPSTGVASSLSLSPHSASTPPWSKRSDGYQTAESLSSHSNSSIVT